MWKNIKWMPLIAVNEMLGGIIGLVVMLYYYLDYTVNLLLHSLFTPIGAISFVMAIIGYGGFCLSFVAGLFLWQEKDKGIVLSIITQVMQVPKILLGGLTYQLISGAAVFGGISFPKSTATFLFSTELSFSFQLNYNSSDGPAVLEINLLAIIIILYLIRKRKHFNEKKSSAIKP